MPDIIHRIGIKASASRVHEAVSTLEGRASWWTEEVKGESRMGGRIEFGFRTPAGALIGSMAMEVEKTESPREVRWRVLEGGYRVHGPLQHEMGSLPPEPARAGGNGEGAAIAP